MNQFPQQAIVLAAGLGTRLKPLTLKIPKPILPVGEVPILFFNLYLIHRLGIKNIVLNLHHLPEKITDLLKPARKLGLKLHYSLEPKILGTAGGIAQALSKMKKVTTLVMNGDILCDIDLKQMVRLHHMTKSVATLACVGKDRAKVSSFVESGPGGRIYRIAGGPKRPKAPKGLLKSIFSGIHLLEPKLFRDYERNTYGCVVRQIYQPALEREERLQAYFHHGDWWDLGSLSELKKVDQCLHRGEASPAMQKLYRNVSEWASPLLDRAQGS